MRVDLFLIINHRKSEIFLWFYFFGISPKHTLYLYNFNKKNKYVKGIPL